MSNKLTANFNIFLIADNKRALAGVVNDLRSYRDIIISHFDTVEEALKNEQVSKKIPVIVHGKDMNDDVRNSLRRLGADGIFHIPREHSELMRSIVNLIGSLGFEKDRVRAKSGIRNQLEKIKKLTPLPSLVHSVLEISNDPKSSAAHLAEVIKKDMTLTARILKIVNSAYFGFHRQIGNVNHAIVILGFEEIRSISLAACLMESFKWRDDRLFNWREFWLHSLGVAFTTRALSKLTKTINPEDAFVIGLLHDFGKVVLEQHFQEEFHQVLVKAYREKRSFNEVCKELLGTDHAEIGSIIAEQWELPGALKKSIEFHHMPYLADPEDYGVYLVDIANYFCHKYDVGASGNRFPSGLYEGSLVALELNDLSLEEIWDKLAIDTEHLKTLL